jgi:hypothetical protein
MPACKEEVQIIIETLKANLTVIKQVRDALSNEEQSDILYPIILQLRDLCDTCIPVLKPNSKE